MAKFTCGRRHEMFAFGAGVENKDSYDSDGRCSYCGGISQERFFELVTEGAEVGPTDKSYKAYVNAIDGEFRKFYFQHLDDAGRSRFIEMLDAKSMTVGCPGHFYVLPFFAKAVA